MPKTIILDIDNVIFNATPLDKEIEALNLSRNKSYEYFYNNVHRLKPTEFALNILPKLSYFNIIFLTARPQKLYNITIAQLKNLGIFRKIDEEDLILRRDDDFRPSHEFKKEEVKRLMDEGVEIVLFVDDCPKNCEAVRSLGIEVLQRWT